MDFKIWGYTDHVASRDFAFLPGGANIKEALEDLNIDTKLKKDGGSNEISAYRHTEERLIGSKTYKASHLLENHPCLLRLIPITAERCKILHLHQRLCRR